MRKYNLEVLGISETHWTQIGQQLLASGKLLLYFGHDEENAPHTQENALMLSKQAQNAVTRWESHGSRIIQASLKTKKEGISMNVVPCYTPINDYNEDAKDQFYKLLNRPAPLNPPNIEAAPTDLPIDIGPPTIEEISMAIRQIKSRKAAGPDNIPAEALRADVAATARILRILFNKIWDEEQVPTD
ncbi:unnamed protein product [Schistosoma mattheei]|uniref:Uncharacterized protein n=1 Tax=Schistosoma mattheei TaxID=31246 RepID=A0A183PST2_9TREM|nr:unnamed protein product [Schistosoma mattheei]